MRLTKQQGSTRRPPLSSSPFPSVCRSWAPSWRTQSPSSRDCTGWCRRSWARCRPSGPSWSAAPPSGGRGTSTSTSIWTPSSCRGWWRTRRPSWPAGRGSTDGTHINQHTQQRSRGLLFCLAWWIKINVNWTLNLSLNVRCVNTGPLTSVQEEMFSPCVRSQGYLDGRGVNWAQTQRERWRVCFWMFSNSLIRYLGSTNVYNVITSMYFLYNLKRVYFWINPLCIIKSACWMVNHLYLPKMVSMFQSWQTIRVSKENATIIWPSDG